MKSDVKGSTENAKDVNRLAIIYASFSSGGDSGGGTVAKAVVVGGVLSVGISAVQHYRL